VNVKMVERLQILAWDRGRWILFFELIPNCVICKNNLVALSAKEFNFN
jgi:hypothetical protein